MDSPNYFFILGFAILGLVIWCLLIRWAVRADKSVANQKVIIEILSSIARQHGVPADEIDGIKNTFEIK
jgi:hypothetical protein